MDINDSWEVGFKYVRWYSHIKYSILIGGGIIVIALNKAFTSRSWGNV